MSAPPNSLEDIASDWLLRSERGLSATDERKLAAWLAADPRHEEAFLTVEETWAKLSETTRRPVAHPLVSRTPALVRWRTALGLAAAAAVILSGALFWRSGPAQTGNYSVALEAGANSNLEETLPDGSVIRLTPGSAVAVRYSEIERHLDLSRGAAHFAVAKNKARPFIVSAGGLDVRAVGTAFDVTLGKASVDVVVSEGRVRLQETPRAPQMPVFIPGTVAELGAGERRTVALAARPIAATPAAALPPSPPVDTVPQRLAFDNTPLAEIVADINRYSATQLVIEDETLRRERFGGSFPAADTDTVVRMLVDNFGIQAERRGNTILLRKGPR